MITDDTSSPSRLTIAPALEAGDVAFLAGFSRHAIPAHGDAAPPVTTRLARVARIWPGQPAVPSPWVPCAAGCCLVLASPPPGPEAVGQWLRFLLAEFLTDDYRLDGRVEVVGGLGTRSILLIVEGRDMFEGDLDPADLAEGVDRRESR